MSKYHYNKYDTDERVGTDLRLVVLGICLLISGLFAITIFIDIQAHKGAIFLPIWLSIGNIDDARVMLSSILSTVSTVLGLVFSVVLLVLSMAASQFGPRLLRRFILDHNGQGTIGLFSATFLFSLSTLVVVRVENGHEFIPQITTLTAIVLMIFSFAALIAFSQSIRKGIQAGNLIARVATDLSGSISSYIELRKARIADNTRFSADKGLSIVRQQCIDDGHPILALNAGYLQNINYDKLVDIMSSHDTCIAFKVHPGNFIIKGTVLAFLLSANKDGSLAKKINSTLSIGPNRTLTQDPEFAFAQIVEIGIRALSAAINDTFTGIACVDWLSNDILSLAELEETEEAWRDKMGNIRIIDVSVKFPRMVAAAFDMMRESGADNPAILIRMLQNFTRIGPQLKNNEQRAAIMRQVKAIHELALLQSFTQTDLKDILECYNNACESLLFDSA
ncbi:DUF2254 domain-containing protein [Legionella fallonii]|uniref:DUF2254 domain-containing protein n=1 Tax=Legionella fallonii TaxID=96230 RepID=UPI0005D3E5C1|nr:DUF2254 domain-containing protein [Legionella fallonii]